MTDETELQRIIRLVRTKPVSQITKRELLVLADAAEALPDEESAGLRAALDRSTRELVEMTAERDRLAKLVTTIEDHVLAAMRALRGET